VGVVYDRMMQQHVTEPFLATMQRGIWPRRWLWLSVCSLALAGIFAIVLVVARTPQLQMWHATKELFQLSLVVHVDLSVLVWFLAMTSFLWSMLRARFGKEFAVFDGASWWCMAGGMALIALSPLHPEWETLKSNYIPVITNLVFFMGLALVMCSVTIGAVLTLLAVPVRGLPVVDRGIYGSVLITLVALAAFVASPMTLTVPLEGVARFENYFWAGGHVLQFTYTQSMLVAWCLMAAWLGYALPSGKWFMAVFWIGPLVVLSSTIPYLRYETHAQEHMDFFTRQMIEWGGVAGAVLWIYCVANIKAAITSKQPEKPAIFGCFVMSLTLFAFGGVFGLMIDGPNVRIPAHYHGSIVAVTLALMGLAYAMVPAIGNAAVLRSRTARWQPYLYGVGQIMHISGLAWSGGYGVLRKTAGDVGDGAWQVKAALGIMGAGGLLAIVGGLCFVVVMLRVFHKKSGRV